MAVRAYTLDCQASAYVCKNEAFGHQGEDKFSAEREGRRGTYKISSSIPPNLFQF